jgi:hypothetical protein
MKQRTMTARARKHRTAIIKILSDLSRGGWQNARPQDYQPLEAELRLIEEQGDDDA